MATVKTYTDIEQSKKLAEILPLESADMEYILEQWIDEKTYQRKEEYCETPIVKVDDGCPVRPITHPCWSLAALLEQLPYELCDDEGNSSYLEINKEDDVYQLVYTDPYGEFESIETDRYEHFVDACYEMILKLHELKML